ncbi:hypothetical protein CERSUDRAFT_117850 [Gelatoporia subvermispora B]|uniref:Uncharacterized protein n=1 Tax=Ceriporiopsis subvermispora (strain B) TaxID=914234 RepID=M2R6G3_CERS8|nr:hypothetical protein CERSUDRAFT_117850 [Gelatoporia subvermispora B]
MTQHLPPPPDKRELEEVRSSFSTLISDHEDVRALFTSVAARLKESPDIDESFQQEWEALRKRYNRLYTHSQRSAGTCATLFNEYISTLVPGQNEELLNDFLSTIPDRTAEAQQLSSDFGGLVHSIGVFQLRVANVLQPTGAWAMICGHVKELWQAIYNLVIRLVDRARRFISGIGALEFSCFRHTIEIELPEYSRLQSGQVQSPRTLNGEIQADTALLIRNLNGFQGAWHLLWMHCSHLRSSRAKYGPRILAEMMTVYGEPLNLLIECLSAFSRGKQP